MIEKLYTVEEVAEMASVTGRTIRNYLKSGRLVGRKIGGQWRFPEGEVQHLLTGGAPREAAAEDWTPPEAPAPREEAAYRPPQEETYRPLQEEADSGGVAEMWETGTGGYYPPPARLPDAPPRAGYAARGVLAPPHAEAPASLAYPPAPNSAGFAAYEPPPAHVQAAAVYPPAPPSAGFATYEQPPVQPSAAYAGGEPPYYAQGAAAGAPPSVGQAPAPAATGYAPPVEQGPLYAPQPYVPPVVYGGAPPAGPAQPYPFAPQGALPHSYGAAAYAPAPPPAEPAPPAGQEEEPQEGASSSLSDVGKRVEKFVSAVHDCSHGPAVCAVVDLHQSLSAAKTTSERLVRIADEESVSGQLCQSYVEFDDRFFIARYTLFGPTPFLLRCLKLIG